MTFRVFQDNITPATAQNFMDNYRHGNYGNNLLPYDSDGTPNTNLLDFGAVTSYWKKGFFTDLVKVGNLDIKNSGFIRSINAYVDAAGTLDLVLPAAAWIGTLDIIDERAGSPNIVTVRKYTMAWTDQAATPQQDFTANGTGGGRTITLSQPNAITIRYTNNNADQSFVSMTIYGNENAASY